MRTHRALDRIATIGAIVVVAALIAIILFVPACANSSQARRESWLLVFISCGAVYYLLFRLIVVRIETVVVERPCAINCRSCSYDLTGLADVGVCPECGVPYQPVVSEPSTRIVVHRDRAAACAVNLVAGLLAIFL
ncbi:MAG: hypothetical protein ACF8LL_06910, partial [Phycisphaerales bacterium]